MKSKNSYLTAAALFTSIILLLLEVNHHYCFLNDDNLDFYLPHFTHSINALSNFEFPFYNFHELLGIPSFANGQLQIFNPIFYISWLISWIFFKSNFPIVDIFIIINIIIASITFFLLLKELSFNNKICFFGAVTWAINPNLIYFSGIWQFVSVFAAVFPMNLLLYLKMLKTGKYRYIIYSGIVRAFLFYCGQPSYALYCIIFELISLVSYEYCKYKYTNKNNTNKDWGKNLFSIVKLYSFSFIITMLLSLPMLLPFINALNFSEARSQPLPFAEFNDCTLKINEYVSIYFIIPIIIVYNPLLDFTLKKILCMY